MAMMVHQHEGVSDSDAHPSLTHFEFEKEFMLLFITTISLGSFWFEWRIMLGVNPG